MKDEEKCCVVTCDHPLDQTYWDNQYQAKATGWDLGGVSPAMRACLDAIDDLGARILIPGCGNTYEAEYLLERGFRDITVIDIAPTLMDNLRVKFADREGITLLLGDFFAHEGTYDYIIEQTFFCAIPPSMRQQYVAHMHRLLAPSGRLTGLLFNREFESGPPFGGNKTEYEALFQGAFEIQRMDEARHSVASRQGTELHFEMRKNEDVTVRLYGFEGITCNGCRTTVTSKFREMRGVTNVSMGADFKTLLVTSDTEIPLLELQRIIADEPTYSITTLS
ncbi:MAG TPA: methyltransferase domain-containing protein [Flavobacterium sp.]|nr:methyltransferase domain-containing protein [Flavobacterium sp.]